MQVLRLLQLESRVSAALWVVTSLLAIVRAEACRSIGISLQFSMDMSDEMKTIRNDLSHGLPKDSFENYFQIAVNNSCYNGCKTQRTNLAKFLNDRTKYDEDCRQKSGVCSLDFRSWVNEENEICTCFVVMEFKRFLKEGERNWMAETQNPQNPETLPTDNAVDKHCMLSQFEERLGKKLAPLNWTLFMPDGNHATHIFYDNVHCDIPLARIHSPPQRCNFDGSCWQSNDHWGRVTYRWAKRCEHAGEWPMPAEATTSWNNFYAGENCNYESGSDCLAPCAGPWSGNG